MLLFVHRYLDEMHDSNPRTGRARGITRLALESPLYAAFVRRYSFLVALFAATTKRWRGGER